MKHSDHLLKELVTYCSSDHYPFHMPGHKRRTLPFPNPWSIDITEIEGFDNLHHATGILQKLQREAAHTFHARKSFCLINGSTCGVLAAISACVKPGGTLLMARNCHKSAYHGVYLRNITPVYLMPETTEFGFMGSLSPETAARALEMHPEAEALFVTSPTYDGVVSDIASLAALAHERNIPLIVDEAHGAHFPFSSRFPDSALSCGADLVIHSLHKTLPAFTQTALLHLNSDRVNGETLKRFLEIYQSSSPSYLLMASVDLCLTLLQSEGTSQFGEFENRLYAFYRRSKDFAHIEIFPTEGRGMFARDASKILISARNLGLSGPKLASLLREEYHLEPEMATGHYVLALSSLMDTAESFMRLSGALLEIDDRPLLPRQKTADIFYENLLYRIPEQAMTPAQALERPGHTIPIIEAAGHISREYLYLYPPGIPLLTPGEVIEPDIPKFLPRLISLGLTPEGLSDMTAQGINVVFS